MMRMTAIIAMGTVLLLCSGARADDLAHTGTWQKSVEELGVAVLELDADGTFVFAEQDRSEEIPGTYTLENGIATFNARSTVVYRLTVDGDALMFARVGDTYHHSDDVVLGIWQRVTDAPVVKPALSGQGDYSVHKNMLTLVDDEGGVSRFMIEHRDEGVFLTPLRKGAIPDEPEQPKVPTTSDMLSADEATQAALYEQVVRAEMRNEMAVELDGEMVGLGKAYQKVIEMGPSSTIGRAAKRRLGKLERAYGGAKDEAAQKLTQ